MAVTGWKFPGTCASVDRDGESEWLNVDRVKISNNSRASSYIVKGAYCDWLRCTNFGFGLGDIPAGATIDGIEVKIEHMADEADEINDSAIYLRNGVGQTGDNKASAAYWPIIDEEIIYGGAADDWNAGLDDAEVRAATFGVDLSAYNDGGNNDYAYVDAISIRITYTPAGAGPAAAGGGGFSGAAGVLLT